jgi:hypothetical protein
MVVRIKSGKSIKGVLNYNEQKVRQGKADLILASGFSCEVENLGFSEKLQRFEKLIRRNERIKNNVMHISLNFPPGERLDLETVQKIASDYMDRIGFGRQPYLVYQHDDSAHPHVHIITTPILNSRKAIYIHNLVQRKSEPARKALEIEYGLIQAETRKKTQPFVRQPADLEAVNYGKAETKLAISNIVREVTTNYKFTSLDELNAILLQFNVTGYRGAVGSRQYLNRGLTYSIIDHEGKKIGVPIKASSIYTSPTLKNLEKKFDRNRIKKVPYKKYVQSKLDAAVVRSTSIGGLMRKLQERNIITHAERNKKGEIRRISFIDPFNRTIFQAEELGYTPQSLLAELKFRQAAMKKQSDGKLTGQEAIEQFKTDISLNILKSLLGPETGGPDQDPGFSKKKRKKRKKPL